MPPDDRRLVAMVAGGRGEALVALYDRHAASAYALARQVTGDEAHAGRAVAEAFLSFWREPSAFHGDLAAGEPPPQPADIPARIFAAAHRAAVDAVRREEALRPRRLEALRDAARVRAIPGGLPADQREALVLSYFGGYTQREVAVLTGTSVTAVSARLLAAARRLRESLDHGPADALPPGHEAAEERVVGWALHALEPGDEHETTTHLAGCTACLALARSYERTLAQLVVALPGGGPPPAVRQTLRRHLLGRTEGDTHDDTDGDTEDGGRVGAAAVGRAPAGRAHPPTGQPEPPPERDPRHPEVAGAVPLDRVQRAVVWSGVAVLLAVTVGLGVWLLVRRG